MLAKTVDSGKSPGGDNDLQSFTQPDPQVIQEYREVYLQLAWKVQDLMSMAVWYTYEKLYQVGCDSPQLSHRIDVMVAYELQTGGYSRSDQINILLYGPYIQSQMLHHCLSEGGARHHICQRLGLSPKPNLRQSEETSGSSA